MSIIISLGRESGHWGMMMLPVTLGYMFGVFHFEQLEKNQATILKKYP